MKNITKSSMERMCRAADMTPVSRGQYKGHEIFVADGFSRMPGLKFRKFGADAGDPPSYITLWFASKGEETLDMGRAIFFGEDETNRQARVNAAMKDARESLDARDKARERLTRSLRLH